SGVPGDVPFPTAEGFRDRPPRREATRRGADGLTVLVGASTASMAAAHREFLLSLAGAGAVVLALALAGGWLLAGRVLAPIHRMSQAAAGISEADPTRRLDVGRTETELGTLAATLNDAFDRMHEAVERRTRFTADASHELRTPVSVVLATAEQALARPRAADEYEEALETVRRAARRMKHLVDDLLTLTRADAGDLPLARDPVDLAEVSRDVLDLVRPLAAEAEVTLSLDGATGVVVPGDRDRLRDALTNLVRNAIRYNRPGGRVTVSVRNGGEDAAIAVEDTGIGIAREHRGRLFERFTRLDEARSRRDGGAGLGLAIAASIVDGHGGAIDVDSTPGVGSTFTITLPRESE
ncbi:MAG: sensor histidine kinase, partial [Planctomycetota bacterium JB042]